jgi:diguanylate cyclase (GGDEF)-like protein
MDRFKDVNDSLGHAAGDQLLIEAARKIPQELRTTDTLARIGGDEFAILLEDIDDISDATRVAERIQESLLIPCEVAGVPVFTSASIGIVLSATGYQRAEEVVRDAEIAMYRAKQGGKARFEIFDAAMRDRIMDRLSLENNLRLAVDRDELRVHYQPIFTLEGQKLVGFEALVRWQHPELGLVSPAHFIPLAEETGLINQIGHWVLHEACRQMRCWIEQYPPLADISISVNLSGKQLNRPDLIEQVGQVIQDTGLDPRLLKLEITESLIMENVESTAQLMRRLHDLHISIQVDDFGVGYSSLSYLSQFPLDTLKIDRMFVRKLDQSVSSLKIIQAIVMLAEALGMDVIAEGVETKEELETLRSTGCEMAQGYYFSRPQDSGKIEDFLAGYVEAMKQ